jgi:hypothetical protein
MKPPAAIVADQDPWYGILVGERDGAAAAQQESLHAR